MVLISCGVTRVYLSVNSIASGFTCAARVTVVVLCVCVSTTILGLQATRRLMSDTNSFSATRARKKCGDFAETTAFERYGVKTS